MGAKLTGTLVAANLLAVSSLAGLQLYGAVRALEADRFEPRVTAIDFHLPSDSLPSNSDLAAVARYPLHRVRVVTRSLDEVVPSTGLLAAVASAEPDEARPNRPVPDQSTMRIPLISEARAEDDPELDAEDDLELAALELGRLTTAAGPALAMRALVPRGRASPEEAWRAKPLLQVAYRARIADPAPVAPAEPAVTAEKGGGEKVGEILARTVRPESPIARGYVVIGSYGTRDNATIEAEAFAHWQPKIMSTEVDGKTYFRVAVGPFTRADLNQALKAVIADGAKDAWPLVSKRSKQTAAQSAKP